MRACLAAALALLLLPPPASAQTTRPVAPRDTFALDPITVTATRRDVRLLDVPAAITVVSAERLRTGAAGLDAALVHVPGVLAQSRSGFSDIRLTIRGFGARGAGDRSNAGTSRGIRVLVDGFPETEPDGRTAFDLVDLALAERVEVVRSNASALYGNAAGGLVSVSTVPAFSRAFVRASGVAGGFGLHGASAEAGTVLGSGKAFAAVTRTTFDGWRACSEAERTFVRVGYAGAAGPRTGLDVSLVGADVRYRIPGPLTQAAFVADPRQANATYAQRQERRYNRQLRLGARLTQQLPGGGTLASSAYVNPKVLQRSERGTFRDFTRIHVGGATTLVQPVHRVEGLSFVAGADAQGQDGAILFYNLTPATAAQPVTGRGTLRTNKGEGAFSGGAYAQAEYETGRAAFALGGRFDAVTYDYRDFILPRLDDRRTFRHLTPKASARYRLSRSTSLYAALGGGIEVPAGNETDPAGTFGQDTVTALNPLLDPMRSTTLEAGFKAARVFEGGPVAAATFDAALYGIGIRDELIPYRGGRFYFNAGRTRRVGLEAGGVLALRGGLAFEGALTLSRNEYLRYAIDSVHYGRPGRSADLRGNAVAGIPEAIYSAGVRWAPPAARGLFAELDVQGLGDYWADDANHVRVPGYARLDVSVGLGRPVVVAPGVQLQGRVGIENVLDRRYAASAFVNPDVVGGQPVYLEPGLPRHATMTLSFTLGR
jgi:iron complex outermembrane recepter protein